MGLARVTLPSNHSGTALLAFRLPAVCKHVADQVLHAFVCKSAWATRLVGHDFLPPQHVNILFGKPWYLLSKLASRTVVVIPVKDRLLIQRLCT